jgi:hypothetical protein
MLDTLPAANAREDGGFFLEPVRRNDEGNGLADRFPRRIPKEAFGAAIPGLYDALEVFTDTLIGSRALTASPKQYRYNVVAHIPLEQPDETPATVPAR